MNRKNTIILIIIVAALLIPGLIAATVAAVLLVTKSTPSFGDKVAVIRVEGVITSGRGSTGLFSEGGAGAERIVRLLERFRKDRSAGIVVLRINSPGGSAAGSQEIYNQIQRVRRDGKQVYVSMGDVAASGGYYIASASDKIFADPATITGSIGVIMETADMHTLLEKVGINFGTIKSGEYKDMGSFSRPMTEAERAILQSLIDDVFEQFVDDVAKGRKGMSKDQIRKLADGRVYTGRQAKELKLVDQLGGMEDALNAAAQAVGIKGEFSTVEYERRPTLFDALFASTTLDSMPLFGAGGSLAELAKKVLHTDARVEAR